MIIHPLNLRFMQKEFLVLTFSSHHLLMTSSYIFFFFLGALNLISYVGHVPKPIYESGFYIYIIPML